MSNVNTRKVLFTLGLGAFGKLADLISKTEYLPQKPLQLLKLLKLTYKASDISNAQLAGEIAKDKELVKKVLNLQNLSETYHNLDKDAYQNAIKNTEKSFIQSLVESQVAKKYFQGLASMNLPEEQLMQLKQNVKAAVIARSVAKWADFQDLELAFLMALMQNAPEYVLSINSPDAYRMAMNKVAEGMNKTEAYLVEFGFDKNEFASKLFRYYSMPSQMIEVMQHGFKASKVSKKEAKKLAQIVNFSRFIADCFADKTQSPSSIWMESQEALKELNLEISPEEWGNKISLLFVKSLEFEMSVSS